MLWIDHEHKLMHACPAAVLAAGLLLGVSPSHGQQLYTSTFQHRLELAADGLLQLVNVSGDITVTGTSGRVVRIRAVKQVQNHPAAAAAALLESLAIEVDAHGDTVEVRTRHPSAEEIQRTGGSDLTQLGVTFTVEVPGDVTVNLRTTSGNIHISGMKGDANLETVNGHITTRDVGGGVVAGSVRGDITIVEVGRGADANTVSGNIVLTDVDEHIRATCISGDITISGGDLVEVWANNTGGNIHCDVAVKSGGRYQLTSHSGNIDFIARDEGGFQVSLSTVSGSISVPLELTLTGARTSRRSLMGIYRQPDASVELTAFSGDITLITVP